MLKVKEHLEKVKLKTKDKSDYRLLELMYCNGVRGEISEFIMSEDAAIVTIKIELTKKNKPFGNLIIDCERKN